MQYYYSSAQKNHGNIVLAVLMIVIVQFTANTMPIILIISLSPLAAGNRPIASIFSLLATCKMFLFGFLVDLLHALVELRVV